MKKVGYFFFSFLPVLASVALQIVVMIPMMGVVFVTAFRQSSYLDMINHLQDLAFNLTFSTAASAIYAAAGICIFGLWYQLQFKGNITKNVKKWLSLKLFLGVICIVPVLQLFTGFLIAGVSSLFPGWLEFYEDIMNSAGFSGHPSLLLILYAVILGPIAEEFTFRGVTMASAKRALPFWAANLLQAFLFGAFHMNMIQGIYAFALGLILGLICEKSGCIWYSVVLHMCFNFWGTFIAEIVTDISPVAICILYLALIFLGILGLWLIAHNLPAKEKFSPPPKESQFPSDIYYN
ncbi:MAG: CPBP family intramembrane metalloprotease [Roseburia sp.]|nr:CPBP family intramembrane metalloprotease [Roseburia sp.]